ncbi:hypothetical protein BKA81DRAFT_407118 [Phyllosticta paracitricarpa]
MPSIPRSSQPTSILSDSHPGSSGSASTVAMRPKRYCIVDHEGREVELSELDQYGLRIQIEVEDDVAGDFAYEENNRTRGHSGAQCLEHADGSVPPAPPNTVESEKVPRRASRTAGMGAGNKMNDLEPRCTHASSPSRSVAQSCLGNAVGRFESEPATFKPTLLFSSIHAPKNSTSSYVAGDIHPSDPDHQYLANHHVSSYPALMSAEQEQDSKSIVERKYQDAESLMSHSAATEREKHYIPSRPATPPAQTDSATEGASAGLTVSDNYAQCEDPHDVFVEQLRMCAMAGAQTFNYEGYIAGTNESCVDLTRYVWQSGVTHGLSYASKIGPANLRNPGHTCGGACDEVQRMRKELDKEKNNVKWEKWNVWEQKEKIKKMTMQHEVHAKKLKNEYQELKDDKERLKGYKDSLESDKEKLVREKMEQERRILLLMEQEQENRARLNSLVMSMAEKMESASLG